MLVYFIASLWSFSEATFFFFIPDIYLTYIAITSPKKAIKACFLAAVAACIGGALMYFWGFYYTQQALEFLTWIPAIFPKLINEVFKTSQIHPLFALFIAPFKGIPYKIYAVVLGQLKIDFFKFILISFFARLFRFLLITSIGILLFHYLRKVISNKSLYYFHVFIWSLIYIGYFLFTYLHYAK